MQLSAAHPKRSVESGGSHPYQRNELSKILVANIKHGIDIQYLQNLPFIQGYYRFRIGGIKQPDKVFENGLEHAQLKLM